MCSGVVAILLHCGVLYHSCMLYSREKNETLEFQSLTALVFCKVWLYSASTIEGTHMFVTAHW